VLVHRLEPRREAFKAPRGAKREPESPRLGRSGSQRGEEEEEEWGSRQLLELYFGLQRPQSRGSGD
jgi:hypothetical protein